MTYNEICGGEIVVNLVDIARKSVAAGQNGEFFGRETVYGDSRRLDIFDREEKTLRFYLRSRLHYVRELYYSAGNKPRRFRIEK